MHICTTGAATAADLRPDCFLVHHAVPAVHHTSFTLWSVPANASVPSGALRGEEQSSGSLERLDRNTVSMAATSPAPAGGVLSPEQISMLNPDLEQSTPTDLVISSSTGEATHSASEDPRWRRPTPLTARRSSSVPQAFPRRRREVEARQKMEAHRYEAKIRVGPSTCDNCKWYPDYNKDLASRTGTPTERNMQRCRSRRQTTPIGHAACRCECVVGCR